MPRRPANRPSEKMRATELHRPREPPRRVAWRGCSSMVERQLPKLHTRVRFPSPAPFNEFTNRSRPRPDSGFRDRAGLGRINSADSKPNFHSAGLSRSGSAFPQEVPPHKPRMPLVPPTWAIPGQLAVCRIGGHAPRAGRRLGIQARCFQWLAGPLPRPHMALISGAEHSRTPRSIPPVDQFVTVELIILLGRYWTIAERLFRQPVVPVFRPKR